MDRPAWLSLKGASRIGARVLGSQEFNIGL